jgi:hypothetical protein
MFLMDLSFYIVLGIQVVVGVDFVFQRNLK